MKIGSKSLMFLGFILAIFGIEYARRKYLETKNENEGFSKASDAAKMTGKITLFIVLLIIFYAGAAFFGSYASAGGGAPVQHSRPRGVPAPFGGVGGGDRGDLRSRHRRLPARPDPPRPHGGGRGRGHGARGW